MKNFFLIAALGAVLLAGCSSSTEQSDAYGNFEATEIIISAEASGKLLEFNVDEGKSLQATTVVGVIDTVQLALKRVQLLAQRQSISAKTGNILSQISVINEQKKVALNEKARIERLLADKAATQKQLDDIVGTINVYERQVHSIETQNSSILGDVRSLDAQIAQLDDQIKKSIIVNPVHGVVLTKYAEPGELIAFGKPLYSIADESEMYLRVYVSGDQLSHVKLGQSVQVLIDDTKDKNRSLTGDVSWVSSKAEFTPKIIQTKEERVNMVYAVKVRVKNDGTLKIGMPGEVNFQPRSDKKS